MASDTFISMSVNAAVCPITKEQGKGAAPRWQRSVPPKYGASRRKADIRPSRCSGRPRTGRRVWGSSWARAAPPRRRGGKQRLRHFGPTRVRARRWPRAPPTRRPLPRRTRPALPSQPKKDAGPAPPPTFHPPSRWRRTCLDSPPWRLPARPGPARLGSARLALPLGLRRPARPPPPARPVLPLTASAQARPLPGGGGAGQAG